MRAIGQYLPPNPSFLASFTTDDRKATCLLSQLLLQPGPATGHLPNREIWSSQVMCESFLLTDKRSRSHRCTTFTVPQVSCKCGHEMEPWGLPLVATRNIPRASKRCRLWHYCTSEWMSAITHFLNLVEWTVIHITLNHHWLGLLLFAIESILNLQSPL